MAVEQLVLFNAFYQTDVMNEADWIVQNLGAMLLRNDGPGAGAEWFARSLSDKKEPATLDELTTTYQASEVGKGGSVTGYTRQALTPNQIITVGGAVDHGEWRIAETSVEFGNPVGGTPQETIEAVVIYIGTLNPANDTTNIPIIMQEYAVGKQTADGPVTANFTNQTLWWKLQA